MHKYITELIGTFFLCLVVGLTGNPVAIGGVLVLLVYWGGHVSGAHYNPAVTIAATLRGASDKKLMLPYFAFQTVGALLATMVVAFAGINFIPAPADGTALNLVVAMELLFTFVLALTILTLATSKALKGNHIYGLGIGLALMVGALAAGPTSGGVFNPAIALGPFIYGMLAGWAVNFSNLLIYLVVPSLGGVLAAVAFKYMNPKG